jgi:hypothetical protein
MAMQLSGKLTAPDSGEQPSFHGCRIEALFDRKRLLGVERQDELVGRESEGRQLAVELGEVRRSRLVAEALDVLAKAKEGRRFDPAHVTKLQKLLLSMERGDLLSGRESEGFKLASELAELRR